MSVADPESELQRLRMSWEEYLELPEKPKAEWVDGEVVVTPPVSQDHGIAVLVLAGVLRQALPDLVFMTEVGVELPRNRLRAPDLMVVERRPDDTWVTEPPVLVVEVLSRATRAEDTIRKSEEYLEGGAGQYWMLDPERRTLDVLANAGDAWEPLLHLDDEHPTGEVAVGEHGTVPVDLGALLR